MARRHRRGLLAGMLLAVAVAAPAQAQSGTEAFLQRLGEIAGQAGDLLSRAETINADWEGREITFSEAGSLLQELEADAALLLAAVQDITPPEEFSAAMDQLTATANDVSAAASAMVAGLRAADSGQARQAAQAQFRDAVGTLQNLAAGMLTTGTTTTAPAPTTSIPATTTTAVAADTTTTVPAATTTIALELGAPDDIAADDGGAPWVLVPLALMAGLAVGLLGGLVLGANTRRRLIDQLRSTRGSADGPE